MSPSFREVTKDFWDDSQDSMSSVVVRKVLDLAPELMTLIQKECFRYYNETYVDIRKRPDFSGEPVLA